MSDDNRLRAELAAQSGLARILAEAPTLAEAGPRLLKAIGEGLEWELGLLWTVEPGDATLRCRAIWREGAGAPAFERLSTESSFGRGEALPGRVWERGCAESIDDLSADAAMPRAAAAERDGLRGAFAFPIELGGRVLGVVEFLGREARRPDERTLDLVEAFGSQIGQYMSRTLAEDAVRRSESRKTAILESALDAVITIDARGDVVDFNSAAEGIFGLRREDAVGREMAALIVPDELRDAHREALRRVVDTGEARLLGQRLELTGLHADGHRFPVELTITRLAGEDPPAFTGYLRDISDRKRAESRARLLAETGDEVSASLDLDYVTAAVGELCVPEMADWCFVDLLKPGRRIERVAVAHSDPADTELARQMRAWPPRDVLAPEGPAKAIRTGQAELIPEISDPLLEALAGEPRGLEVMRRVGFRSGMVVPLRARGRMLGALSLASAASGRRFGEDDLAFAQEIARRAALAIDNARIHAERSRIAATLQSSLLPPRLPRLPGVAVASRFRAAGEAHQVGGDFFDLFCTAPGDWTIVMGDVSGKGPEAAAVTALARYTVREAAAHDALPSSVLTRLNEAILSYQAEGGDRFCTAVVGRLELAGRGAHLTLAAGGHPLPLRLDPEGRVEPIGTPGMLLGVARDPDLHDAELELEAGDSVLLFTDGVSETPTATGILGEGGLAALLESLSGLDAEALVAHVDEIVVGLQSGTPRDDIAMVALQVQDPARDGAEEDDRSEQLAAISVAPAGASSGAGAPDGD